MRRIVDLVLLGALPLLAAEYHGVVKFGGLPVPGATVTASRNGAHVATITGEDGAFSLPSLEDGSWTISVEMLCFQTQTREITLPGDSGKGDWELKLLPLDTIRAQAAAAGVYSPAAPAPAAEPVKQAEAPRKRKSKKNAAPAPANTASAFQRTDVNASSSAAAGTPGADAAVSGNENPAELAERAREGFVINGASNNGASSPFALAPAFGNFRKGPGSLYNGMLGFTLDNSSLDARAFSITGQDTAKPSYNHLTGLASFGGPLKIPHLIRNGPNIIVNYQWTRDRKAGIQPALMPAAAERIGDLSSSPVPFFDPAGNGAPFPGNRIPLTRIATQASRLLGLYPDPNFFGGAPYNYQIPLVGATHDDSLQTRANKTINRKNQVSGDFAYESTRAGSPNVFGFLDTTDTLGIKSGANWRHSFAPRLFGNLGVQYSRQSIRVTPFFSNRTNISGNAMISGNDADALDWGPPALSFSGGVAGLTDAQQSLTRDQTAAVSFAGLWIRGRHNIAFGGDFKRQQFNLLGQQDARGTFTFTGAATSSPAITGSGSSFADFLLGVPDTSSVAFGNADKYFRDSLYDLFATDDWRIGPGLTVNAGARWEYGSPMVEKYGRLTNLDLGPGYVDLAPGATSPVPVTGQNPTGPLTGRPYRASLIAPYKRGVQPRIGISWRPFAASSTIVRAGYGVYYNTSVYYQLASQMAQQNPFSKNVRVQNSPQTPLSMAQFPNTSQVNFGIDPAFRPGYAQNWQLTIQRDLPGALVVSATYLGTKGTRGVQEFLPNTYPLAVPNPCLLCGAGYTYVASNGNSTREAGQIQLRRRLHNGLTATAQYTFAKAIDDAALGGRGEGQAVIAQNWLNLAGERGLSNFDQRHLLKLQLQYTTGMGIGGGTLVNGWKGAMFKEWTVSTQITIASGLPLTPIYYYAVPGTGVTGSVRPDYTGASVAAAPAGLFLNPDAYVPPASGEWGNAGRNSITGPGQFTLNASLGRTFRVSDRFNVDLRFDSTNALNHVTYPSWNTTINNAQFGLPGNANAMRSVQTTLRVRF